MEFKDRLKQLRESRGLTQRELADKLNKLSTDLSNNSKIYTQTISYWENGRDPSIGMLIKIAQYFDVPTDYLLGKTDSVSIDEINFEYFSRYLSKQNIEKLIKSYPDNMKKAVYFLLSNYTSDIFINFNNEKRQYEINLDFLYLITKAVDILKSFYDEIENKVLCYNTESSLNNVKYIDSISKDTLKNINKLKALTKIGLDSIVDKLEDLVLFCDDPSNIKFEEEILEYTSTSELNKNYFSKHLKKVFTDLVDDVLDASKCPVKQQP